MELNKDLKVEVSKTFSASVDELYKAWTNPEQLKQWWRPMGNSLKEVIDDLREGGTVKYVFDRNELVIAGKYLEVKDKEKLVYTWNWELPQDTIRNAEYKLTVNFLVKDTGSEIKVLQENFQQEETMLPHQEGWEKGISDLEQFLSGNTYPSEGQSEFFDEKERLASEQKAEAGGYLEDPDQVKVGGG